jgi:hypothetical protein
VNIVLEKFERKGVWWLPDDPDKTLRGTLTYHPGFGAELETTDGFEPFGVLREHDIINGMAGSEITLYKCYTTPTTSNSWSFNFKISRQCCF